MAQALKDHCLRGHPMTGDNVAIRSNGYRRCKACHNIHNGKYNRKFLRATGTPSMRTYREKRKPTPITSPDMAGRNGGAHTAKMHQRRNDAKRTEQAVFWKRSTGLTLMGRLIEEQAEKVVYRNQHGIESRLPKVDGWLLVLPADQVPGLPELPAVA